MSDETLQLPELKEIQEMLVSAREDIQEEVQADPELEPATSLLYQVIDAINEKIANKTDLNTLNAKAKIDIAAHLHFLQLLLEDFFYFDEEFEDDDEEDGEEFEWEETNENEKP